MNKEDRERTWMNMTYNYGDGDMELQISIQDFLDGDISCITGTLWDEDDPQRDMFFEDFIQHLLQEWRWKKSRDYEMEVK
jgi:hypothetical protein